MKKYTRAEFNDILKLHELWLKHNPAGIRADLPAVNLRDADLRGINLYEAYLYKADLGGAELVGADLRKAILSYADVSAVNLRKVNLRGANLCGASLYKSDLTGVDLREVDLSRADLRVANLSGADLYKANLSNTDLTDTKLSYPIYQAYLGQYHIHTNKEYIRIGCEYKTVQDWLLVTEDRASKIGLNREHYKDYMDFVKWYAKKDVSKLK